MNKDDYLILKFHFETSKLNGYGGVRKKHIYLQNKEFTQEKNNICLRSQFVTLNKKDNFRVMHFKYLPYVLTEQGIMMLSGLLKSRIATEINVKIMRAFVEMRKYINSSLIEQKYINEMILKNNKRIGLLEESFDKMKEKTKVSTIFYEYVKNSTKSFYRTRCCNNYNNMKKVTH